MNCKLIKIGQLSGILCSVYSLYIEDEHQTLLDRFLAENKNSFKSEIYDIVQRITTMSRKTGAREQYFKTKEGKPGDAVCALYDNPNSKLRLYCIRLGTSIIILGGGGPKLKSIKALQEDPKLTLENRIMVKLSAELFLRFRDKNLYYTNDTMDLDGDMEFELQQ